MAASGTDASGAPGAGVAPAPDLSTLEARVREAAFVEAADCFAALVWRPDMRMKLLQVRPRALHARPTSLYASV